MNQLHKYINIGIYFAIIIGTLLHFTYDLSGVNKIVGYFSPINESIWEHTKLAVFPILLYSLFMFIKLRGQINNTFFALAVSILISILIILIGFYTYIKFTKVPLFPLDITLFLLAVIIPFKIMEKILLLPKFTLSINILGLIIILFITFFFIKFTYNPPLNKIFIEGIYK
ncbi:MAG: DUF6512 family protein [Paraclostridium sp.]